MAASALLRSRVLRRPVERVVGNAFPAGHATGEVRAVRKLVGLGRGLGVAVLLRVRTLYRGRHQMVFAAHDEQQRRAVVKVIVDPGLLVARLPVGYQAV